MSYQTAKTAAKLAMVSAIETNLPATLTGLQIVQALEYVSTKSKHIQVGCNASPDIVGDQITGWNCTIMVNVVTDAAHASEDDHEEVCAAVEQVILDSNLNTSLTHGVFNPQWSAPGESVEAVDEDRRITNFQVEVHAYLTGVV
jgi:hypothetical protein